MRLCNPFKSFAWVSFFRPSRSRVRRCRANFAPNILAAEILELRAMLSSANVTVNASATVLTLTSDNNGDHSVNVYRLDATHVEVDAIALGTTINGGASVVFAFSSISGITVNVGNGYDSYNIFSKSGDPALNVGAGGILFKGAGGTGDNLQIYNGSANAMTILGNVTLQGSTTGSALNHSGSSESDFFLYTNSSGSLTVNGSVSASQSGTGSGSQFNSIYTNGAGNLSIFGFVTESLAETASGHQENHIDTHGAGNVSIGLDVMQTVTGGSGGALNQISPSGGNISMGSAVMQTASNSNELANQIYTQSTGNLTINGSVSQKGTSSNANALNSLYVGGNGNVTVGGMLGGITQTASGMGIDPNENKVSVEGAGSMSLGCSVAQTATSTSQNAGENVVENMSAGNMQIAGSVAQSAPGPGYDHNDILGSNITINGSVMETALSTVDTGVNRIFGNLTVGAVSGGITQIATGPNLVQNIVYASSGSITVGSLLGSSIKQSATSTGNGNVAFNFVAADYTGNLSIAAAVTQTGSGAWNDVHNGGSGNVSIGTLVTQTDTGTDPKNYVYIGYDAAYFGGAPTQPPSIIPAGTLAIGQSIAQNATATAGHVEDYVYNSGSSSFMIGPGGVTINESSSATTADNHNEVFTISSGSLLTTGLIKINTANDSVSSIITKNATYTKGSTSGTLAALGIVITDAGSQKQENYAFSDGAAITIGPLGITIIGSGAGYHDNEIYTESSSSPMTIAGPVTVIDTGTGHSYFEIEADAANSPIMVGGSVSYDNHLNTTGRSNVKIVGSTDDANSILTIKGSVIVTLAQTSGTAVDNDGYSYNAASIGEDEGTNGLGFGAVVNGLAIITGSGGQDKVYIEEAQLKLGAIINTQGNPSPGATWHDELEIDGSAFGSTVLVVMSGPNAEIDINNGKGFQPTVFSGLFEAIMTGPNALIVVADGSGNGYSHATFSAGAIAIGSPGAGDLFKYHAANVTGPIIPILFSTVIS